MSAWSTMNTRLATMEAKKRHHAQAVDVRIRLTYLSLLPASFSVSTDAPRRGYILCFFDLERSWGEMWELCASSWGIFKRSLVLSVLETVAAAAVLLPITSPLSGTTSSSIWSNPSPWHFNSLRFTELVSLWWECYICNTKENENWCIFYKCY